MDVEEAALLEEVVDGEGQRVAHAGDGAEGVGARPQVGHLAQTLEGDALLLQRILGRLAEAQHLDGRGLDLDGLLRALATPTSLPVDDDRAAEGAASATSLS